MRGAAIVRGEILSFDDVSGTGLISGDDGARYSFDRSSIQSGGGVVRAGARVDFVAEGDQASQIVVITSTAAAHSALDSLDTQVAGFDWKTMLFSFEGRLRRSHFWIGWLILLGVGVVAGWIPVLGGLISLLLIWPNLAIGVKRLHDMGQTGWLIVVPWLVTVVGIFVGFGMIGMSAIMNASALQAEDPLAIMALIGPAFGLFGLLLLVNLGFLLWIGLTDSQKGDNRFGPNPKGE